MRLLIVFLVWVLGFGAFSIAFRKMIAKYVAHFHMPIFLKHYLILMSVILLEEALTIEVPYFWGILPMIVAFSIFFLLLYLFQRLTRCSYWVLSILCWLIYAVMAILPSAYLQLDTQIQSNHSDIA